MNHAKVFKLTGIACQSQLISCSSVEPDAWVPLADHCEEVKALKAERVHDLNQIGGLQEENARLKADLEKSDGVVFTQAVENERLKSEVERLTDAITRGAITPDAKPAEPDPDYLTVYLYAAELAKDSMKKVKNENAFLKMEVERLKNNAAYLDTKLDEELDKNG